MNDLLKKYELNTCSQEERKEVEAILSSEPSKEQVMPYISSFKSITHNRSVMDQLLLEPTYVDALLDEYADGLCSSEEAAWVENYMANIDMPVEYKMYSSSFKNVTSDTSYNTDEVPTEEMLNTPDYSEEYIQYKAMYQSLEVPTKVKELEAVDTSIEVLLEKAEKNTLSSKEQLWFDALVSYQENEDLYQEYIELFKSQTYLKESIIRDLTHSNTDKKVEKEAKVISLRKRLIGIAAAVGLFIVGFIGIQNMTPKPAQTAEIIEINDPEEALEVTLAALSMVGRKLNTGQQEISKIKHLGKTNIFK